MGKRAGTF